MKCLTILILLGFLAFTLADPDPFFGKGKRRDYGGLRRGYGGYRRGYGGYRRGYYGGYRGFGKRSADLESTEEGLDAPVLGEKMALKIVEKRSADVEPISEADPHDHKTCHRVHPGSVRGAPSHHHGKRSAHPEPGFGKKRGGYRGFRRRYNSGYGGYRSNYGYGGLKGWGSWGSGK